MCLSNDRWCRHRNNVLVTVLCVFRCCWCCNMKWMVASLSMNMCHTSWANGAQLSEKIIEIIKDSTQILVSWIVRQLIFFFSQFDHILEFLWCSLLVPSMEFNLIMWVRNDFQSFYPDYFFYVQFFIMRNMRHIFSSNASYLFSMINWDTEASSWSSLQ